MKKFLLFIVYLFIQNATAQPQFYYEQNSTVTVNLTSVCMIEVNMNPVQEWVCGYNGTVLKSTNGGDNWINVGINGIPTNVNLVNITCKAFDTVLTAGNIGTTSYVYRTMNGGLNWVQVFSQVNGNINAIWMKSALQGFMTGNPVGGRWSLWKTNNFGLNWDSSGLLLPQNGTETGWNNSLQMLNNNIWFGTNNSRIYYSSNYGANWLIISTSPEINSTSLWFYSNDTAKGCFGGNNLYQTTNRGINWIQVSCPDTGKFRGFCFGPVGVINQPPWGQSFTVRSNSRVYISWGVFSNFLVEYNAPAGNYNHIAYNNFNVYGSPSGISWGVRSNGGITKILTFRGGAVRRISSEVPTDFKLYQNYPNPFNSNSKIKFQIAKVSDVNLSVYDVLGREVTKLVNEQLKPGMYEVEWDGTNYTSGVYFYKLVVGDNTNNGSNFSETKTMALLR